MPKNTLISQKSLKFTQKFGQIPINTSWSNYKKISELLKNWLKSQKSPSKFLEILEMAPYNESVAKGICTLFRSLLYLWLEAFLDLVLI